MLTKAVESYIAMRRACGFAFRSEGTCLQGFAAFSDAEATIIPFRYRHRVGATGSIRASEPAGSVL